VKPDAMRGEGGSAAIENATSGVSGVRLSGILAGACLVCTVAFALATPAAETQEPRWSPPQGSIVRLIDIAGRTVAANRLRLETPDPWTGSRWPNCGAPDPDLFAQRYLGGNRELATADFECTGFQNEMAFLGARAVAKMVSGAVSGYVPLCMEVTDFNCTHSRTCSAYALGFEDGCGAGTEAPIFEDDGGGDGIDGGCDNGADDEPPSGDEAPDDGGDGGGPPTPAFPWPPPKPTTRYVIKADHLGGGETPQTLKEAADRLVAALERAEYDDLAFFSIRPAADRPPEGFALVTRLERIYEDGRPWQGDDNDRWKEELPARDVFSLTELIRALFTAPEGHYRVIVFAVTGIPVVPSAKEPTRDDAGEWLGQGLLDLPRWLGELPWTPDHACTALIYQFRQVGAGREPEVNPPGAPPARVQLERSGILAALRGE